MLSQQNTFDKKIVNKLTYSVVLIGGLLITAAIGLTRMLYPLDGDQALFMIGAIAIDGGEHLYVDFWDNKQPGIFWFYGLAGKLFEFDLIGLHVLELIWLLSTAIVILLLFKQSDDRLFSLFLAPLLTVGLFYWHSTPIMLTQVEILVCLPIVLTFLVYLSAENTNIPASLLFFIAGLLAGIVAAFKLVLVLVPVALWLVMAVYTVSANNHRQARTVLLRNFLATILGGGIMLAAVTFPFFLTDTLEEFFWANLIWPTLAVDEVSHASFSRLMGAAFWLVTIYAPAIPLAVFWFWDLRRRGITRLELLTVSWLVAGLLAIAMQKFSWWMYHFSLLIIPAGILITCMLSRVIQRLVEAPVRVRAFGFGITCFLIMSFFLINLKQNEESFLGLLRSANVDRNIAASRFASIVFPSRLKFEENCNFLLDEDSTPGDIYVFGNPNLVLCSRRSYAIPINGWSWEFMLSSQWETLPDQLAKAQPSYIFVADVYSTMINERAPDVRLLISASYVDVRKTDEGTWYQRISN
jgi:hypothetical protein